MSNYGRSYTLFLKKCNKKNKKNVKKVVIKFFLTIYNQNTKKMTKFKLFAIILGLFLLTFTGCKKEQIYVNCDETFDYAGAVCFQMSMLRDNIHAIRDALNKDPNMDYQHRILLEENIARYEGQFDYFQTELDSVIQVLKDGGCMKKNDTLGLFANECI